MQNDDRLQTRKAISLASGAAMALASAAGYLWMLVFAMASIGVTLTGIAILYDDLRGS